MDYGRILAPKEFARNDLPQSIFLCVLCAFAVNRSFESGNHLFPSRFHDMPDAPPC
jgi:hypothetical protein